VKILIVCALLSLLVSTAALADGTIYHIFADGLACQHCAETIDKQLREIEGVERVDILPGRGIVNVRMADSYALGEAQMAKMLAEAGVTFRRMEQHTVGAGGSGSGVAALQTGIADREYSL
jgi:copper chaperone CopZ